jgi:hypothetical protein
VIARIIALGMAVMLGLSGTALACHGKRAGPALDDTFKTPDPGWGPPDQAAAFTADGLVLTPPVNGSAWRWNQNYTLNDGDLCVQVVNPARVATPSDTGDAGAWFWAQDAQNFYTATLSLDGTVSVDRLINGVWHVVMPPTASGAVRTNAGAANEIEVLVNGNAGSFFVNGIRVTDFTGQAPARGGPPGVYAESGGSETKWVFPRVQLF